MLRSAMFGLSMFLMCFMFAVVPLTGCGDNNKTTEKSDEATTDASTPTEQNTGFRTCEPGEKINDCQGSGDCKAERDCDRLRGYEQAGMCFDNMCGMTPKKQDATIQKDKKEAKPDWSCLTSTPALPSGPEKTTLWGRVEAFGLSSDTTGLKVEVFKQADFLKDPNTATPIGTYTSDVPKSQDGCTETCGERHICYNKKCVKIEDSSGYAIAIYDVKDVPTNTLLAVRTSGDGFVATIQYNLWVPADKVKDDLFELRSFVISEVTKSLIPATAGISKIADGNAAIAGEVQDCSGEQVQGVTVNISARAQKLGYFNGDGDQPDPEQNETNRDGTYAALNIKVPENGDINVLFVANIDGKPTKLLKYGIKLFPDAISVLTVTPWHPGLK
ncbi:MAG: hypothetical protein CL920_11035 [Deltaproteobacteria bacterium]|nr:hypothetical protein [Deltaproteobacteria bacterium]